MSNTEEKLFQEILTKKTDLLDISFLLLLVDIPAPSSMQKRIERAYSSVDGYTSIHIPKTNHPHDEERIYRTTTTFYHKASLMHASTDNFCLIHYTKKRLGEKKKKLGKKDRRKEEKTKHLLDD